MGLTYVVVRLALFQRTKDVVKKPVPTTVRIVAGAPAATFVGAIDPSVGVGWLTPNVAPGEVPPPGAGLKTVRVTVPGVARFGTETVAVRDVGLT